MTKLRLLGGCVSVALLAGTAQATITVTAQEVLAHCDGFASDPAGFGGYNHGVANALIGDHTAPDSDAFTAGAASVSSSGMSMIDYSSMAAHLLQLRSEGDYKCFGNGGGTNTTSLGSGHVNFSLDITELTNYDITVQILDVGAGGFSLVGSGVTVGFGAGVGTYHLTGTLTPYTYYWDMNGSVNDSTSGVSYSHRARMIIDAKFNTVPEPSAWMALAVGLGIAVRRRRA